MAVSTLSLCDLAGSERTNRTKAGGDRLREAGEPSFTVQALLAHYSSSDVPRYLTIIPRAQMGYESIAHEAEGIIIVLVKSN